MNTHESRLHEIREAANGKAWTRRHFEAIAAPNGEEIGFLEMLRGWLQYADAHRRQFDGGIGEDYYCGPEWAQIGATLIRLLSGPVGDRLDLGTLDSVIRGALTDEGFDANNL
jgi:hypothetical protein